MTTWLVDVPIQQLFEHCNHRPSAIPGSSRLGAQIWAGLVVNWASIGTGDNVGVLPSAGLLQDRPSQH